VKLAEPVAKAVPGDLDLRAALAIAYEGLGRREEAIKEYQSILAANPNAATIWGNLGWTQYGAGKLTEAIESSRKALERDPSLAYVRLNIGLIYAVQGDWENSRKEYEAAFPLSKAPDISAGIDDIRDALRKKPDSAVLKQALALLQAAKPRA
jgi:tetratricopeptide (TPR) repeat protein